MSEFITMAHGNGGAAMQKLIQDYFVEAFANPILAQGEDQARIPLTELAKQGETLSFSTDSFVIDPIFFPGGNIGKLAVCGTANDVAVCGAIPKYLSCGFILEEGLPLEDLKAIIQSMDKAPHNHCEDPFGYPIFHVNLRLLRHDPQWCHSQ